MTDSGTPANALDTIKGGTVKALLDGTLKIPDAITRVIDVQGWARSVITGEAYTEPDPEYLSRMLLLQTLTSESIEEAMNQQGIHKLQEWIPNVPGAGTSPIEVSGLYVAVSDFDEGLPTYIIVDGINMTTGLRERFSTGAGQLQAQFMVALCLNQFPLKCQVKRTDRKDKGGRYLFWLYPPDQD